MGHDVREIYTLAISKINRICFISPHPTGPPFKKLCLKLNSEKIEYGGLLFFNVLLG